MPNKTIKERRLIIQSGMFSTTYYLIQNPDVSVAKVDPIEHYCEYGWKEGRNPSSYFNTNSYLAMYEDIVASGMNPLLHYIQYGKKEGRLPLPPQKKSEDDNLNPPIQVDAKSSYQEYRGPTKGDIEFIEKNSVSGWLLSETKNCMPVVRVNGCPTLSLVVDPESLDGSSNSQCRGEYKAQILSSIEGEAEVELSLLSEEGITPVQKKKIKNNSLVPNKYADLEKALSISKKTNAVAITVWEGAHNPIGRAKVLYDVVASKRPVVIFAYIFGDFGNDLWEPLRNAGLNVVLIPYSKRYSYHSYIQEQNIKFDTVWICKHRVHSFELASIIAKPEAACILDIDDNEDVFTSSKASEFKPYGIVSKNKANYYLNRIPIRSVASISIQKAYGGEIMRHARKAYVKSKTVGIKDEPKTKTAVFIGTIRPHKNVTELVNAISAFNRLSPEKIKLAIGGDFNPPSLKQTLDTKDTIILDNVSSDNLYPTLDDYDIVITGFPDKKNENSEINKLQITSKIGDGLAVGLPVLTPSSPSVEDLA